MVTKSVIKVNCEWDLDHEGDLFECMDDAVDFIKKRLKSCGVPESYEECIADGLIWFETLNAHLKD